MSFLSLKDVSDSFVTNCKQKFSSPDWGVICILHSISSSIIPGQSYEIDKSKLGDKLNELFTFVSKDSRSNSLVYATFSNTWLESFFGKFDNKLSLIDLAIWYYRKTNLPNTIISSAQLIDKFVADLHLPMDKLSVLVDTSSDKTISLNNSLYSDGDLLKNLSDVFDFTITKDSITLKAEGSMVVKCASDFGAGPFTQTLYASKGFANTLLLTDFKLSELYTEKNKRTTISLHNNKELIDKVRNGFERFLRLTNKQMENRVHYINVLEKELSPLLANIDDSISSIYQVVSISYLKSLIRNLVLQDNSWQHLLAETWSDANVSSSKYNVWTIYRQYYNYLSIIDISDFRANIDEEKIQKKLQLNSNQPLQQIFYGAPGTGKSFRINEMCAQFENYRTTFHPDTDYASFVGSYKPITKKVPVYGIQGTPLLDDKLKPIYEDRIVYRYIFQSFLKAYIAAWKEQQNENPKPVFLVIEEINRGNCAQIFGDIFQLLDRNEAGYSDYPIVADDDLAQELSKVLCDLTISNADAINGLYLGGQDVVSMVKNGSHLLLPNNLYIWATMNTSDQSLFPIDSAFKRRWEWKYIKIQDAQKNYRISFSNGNEYDWWQFVSAINAQIEGGEIQQEDKKLGYFFAKAKDGIISAETFVSKVLFYLYNDVFKDFGLEEDFFQDELGSTMTFTSYFNERGEVCEDRVEKFITNLHVEPINSVDEIENDITLG